jgi:hypothetical protein
LIKRRELPANLSASGSEAKIKKVREAIAAGRLTPPPRTTKKSRSPKKLARELKPSRVRREPTFDELRERLTPQQERRKAERERLRQQAGPRRRRQRRSRDHIRDAVSALDLD